MQKPLITRFIAPALFLMALAFRVTSRVRKGYGVVMMVNSDNGMAPMNQVADRVQQAYHWDSLQKANAR
jgi:hypothetical protein